MRKEGTNLTLGPAVLELLDAIMKERRIDNQSECIRTLIREEWDRREAKRAHDAPLARAVGEALKHVKGRK